VDGAAAPGCMIECLSSGAVPLPVRAARAAAARGARVKYNPGNTNDRNGHTHNMGFEQLAALRDQLAAQAEQERRAKRQQQGGQARAGKDEGKPAEGRAQRPAKPGDRDAGKPAGRQAQGHGQGAERRRDGKPGNTGQGQAKGQGRRPPHAGQGQGKPARAEADQAPRDPLLVAIGRLQKHFPKAFPKRPDPRVPLKLGIITDLYAHAGKLGLDEAQIKEAVATWCSAGRYWAVLIKDAERVDLDGTPCGQVTAAEAAHASFLARRQRKQKQAAGKPADATAQAGTTPQAPAAEGAPHDAAADKAGEAASPATADTTTANTAADTTPAPDTPQPQPQTPQATDQDVAGAATDGSTDEADTGRQD